LRCLDGDIGFALAGGDFGARVDAADLGRWTTGVMYPGSCLTIRDGRAGNWASLAFAGALAAPTWLGSAATLALAGLGGGRLVAGDILTVMAMPPAEPRAIVEPPAETGPIRIVLGPQEEYFAPAAMAALLAGRYFAGSAFDRMGMVLDGPALLPLSVTMLSAPLLRGAIQVNGAGVPTILLADHQTTAGYPRIATVIDADVDRAAQLRPGLSLQFAAVTVQEANAIARRTAQARTAWLATVSGGAESLLDRLLGANLIDGVVDARR
jgi:allophanate hydrolase